MPRSRLGGSILGVANITPRVYVPNNHSNTVDVIDPTTFRVSARSMSVSHHST